MGALIPVNPGVGVFINFQLWFCKQGWLSSWYCRK
jgi:hypothetical protein